MNNAVKIAIGAGAAALLGWFAHGPIGMGAAFVSDLQRAAKAELAMRGISNVAVNFPADPLSRIAMLEGQPSGTDKNIANALVKSVPGIAFTQWVQAPGAGAAAEGMAPAPEAHEAKKPAAVSLPSATAAVAAVSHDPAVSSCQDRVDKVVNGRMMNFRSGSAWLNAQSQRIVADLAGAMKNCPGMVLEIGGHTDGSGDEAINRTLSDERARRVRDALIARGVSANAITAKGHGSSAPLHRDNKLDPANRRIAFTIAKGGA
jgi:OOP family OmpA-OmpF porin